MFNALTALYDEGLLTDDLTLKERYDLDVVNYHLGATGNSTFETMQEFINFIDSCKNIINIF